MATHRVYLDSPIPQPGQVLEIVGDEARHARAVKRLGAGDRVEVLDGRGTLAIGVIEDDGGKPGGKGAMLRVRILTVEIVEQQKPLVNIWSAAPKGDRLSGMIEQLAQVGAHSWGLLETSRGVVTPREAKFDRLRRVASEAAKQCGRAHGLVICESSLAFDDPKVALPSGVTVVADGGGRPLAETLAGVAAEPVEQVHVLVGPEGGLTDEELSALDKRGVRRVSLGPHIMRIETAAVVAAAAVVSAMHWGKAGGRS